MVSGVVSSVYISGAFCFYSLSFAIFLSFLSLCSYYSCQTCTIALTLHVGVCVCVLFLYCEAYIPEGNYDQICEYVTMCSTVPCCTHLHLGPYIKYFMHLYYCGS